MNADDCIFRNPAGYPIGIDIGKCAEFVTQKYNIITLLPCKKYETMLYYNDGMYVDGAYPLVRQLLENEFGTKKNHEGKELLNIRRKEEIIDKVVSRTYREMYQQLSPIRIPTFDHDINVINLCNGLYNFQTGEFSEHSSKYLSRCQVAVEYNPETDCSTILEILADVLKPSDIDKYIEFLAYCFYRDYNIIQKCMILLGPAGSGKSQLTALPRNLIGNWNTTCVTLQMLGGNIPDQYATAKLYNKLINIVGDMDNTYIREVGKFKMMTSGEDLIPARYIYGSPFEFENYAKMMGSANELPPVNDRSDGFYRRCEILECRNKFSSDGDKFDRLIALEDPQELSGLFNLCMEKLPNLIERRKFTNSMSIEEARRLYRRSSNTIEVFLDECVRDHEGSFISKEELFRTYCRYAKENGLAHCSNKISFGRALKKIGFEAKMGYRMWHGERAYCWLDVEVRMMD